MASWNEEGYGGGYLPSTGNSLAERKRQLLQWMAGRGATQAGYRGSAVGRMGGIGGKGPLPSLTYNPFFSQIVGRRENFPELPLGITPGDAQRVQGSIPGPTYGIPDPVNAPPSPPGIGAMNPVMHPGVSQPQFTPQSAAPSPMSAPSIATTQTDPGRNLIGMAPPPPPVQAAIVQAAQQSAASPAPSPYIPYVDPYARLLNAGSRNLFRE